MKAAKHLRREDGSTTIEAIGVLMALSLTLILGLGVAYLSFARVWIERNTYEALICLGASTSTHRCIQSLHRTVEGALPIGNLATVNSSRNPHGGSLTVRFEIGGKTVIRHSAKLRYPLTSATQARAGTRATTRSAMETAAGVVQR